MALAGPPRSHEKWSRRLKLTSALLGATRARFPSVTREPQAPQTVALEHEHQTLDRRGSSRRRPYFHISECVARSDVPSDHALVASLDGLMPCEILKLMAQAIASEPRHPAFVLR